MKKLKGTVLSKKMNKTIVVQVERTVVHPIYKKRQTTYTKYLVHENQDVEVGQKVEILETKPISKKKRFIIFTPER